jgi:hypothetical protein
MILEGPHTKLKTQNSWENPNCIAMKDDNTLDREISPESNVNLNHWLHRDIIIFIFIYVYIYICYVQKTEISGTIKPPSLPPYKCNCSSTLGTVLGYTCRILGKARVDSLNTGL